MDHRDGGRQAGPGGQLWIDLRAGILDFVDVKLNFQAAAQAVALLGEPRQSLLQDAARIHRDRLTTGLQQLPLQPTGLGSPGQLLEAAQQRLEHEITGLREGREHGPARQAIGFKHFEGGAIAGVFERLCADHANAVLQSARQGARQNAFGAQLAMQIAPSDAHLFDA